MASALVVFASASALAQTGSTLTGVVRDSAGAPLADVEVLLRDAGRGTRTNQQGQFTLEAPPRSYVAWFRRLGYRSIEYTWAARSGQRVEINIVMPAVPRQLDPVVVRADEDKRAKAHASLLGLVLDSTGTAIPEAEVQLVGADIAGTTRSNGGFLFKPLGIGTYVVRVRKLGYAPSTTTVQLVPDDDHEIVVYMRPLAQSLEPVIIAEKSGYGKDQTIWDELERRKRFQSFQTRFFGPEDLKSFYGADLETATIRMGMNGTRPSIASRQARSIMSGGRPISRAPTPDAGFACLLLNGKDGIYGKLSTYTSDDLEMLEVWPAGTELSGTVSWYFHDTHCQANGFIDHPMYYVLWFKNR
ncbi:MAG TPA: carboxypeptidase regulatory-like domain-containing protein [Gemmatimonadaceae bacterium]